MDSRRNFVGKVAYGLAGTLAAGPARVLGANERVRIGIIGAGDRGMELVNHIRACSNTEIAGFADVYSKRLETAAGDSARRGGPSRLPESAGRSGRGRGDHRDSPASSRAAVLRCDRGGQARVSRKSHGAERSSGQADARRLRRRPPPSRGPDRPSGLLHRSRDRRSPISLASRSHGQDHGDRHADASQHAGEQAAVGPARAADAGSDAGPPGLGGVPGRCARARVRSRIVSCTGDIFGITPAAACSST